MQQPIRVDHFSIAKVLLNLFITPAPLDLVVTVLHLFWVFSNFNFSIKFVIKIFHPRLRFELTTLASWVSSHNQQASGLASLFLASIDEHSSCLLIFELVWPESCISQLSRRLIHELIIIIIAFSNTSPKTVRFNGDPMTRLCDGKGSFPLPVVCKIY